MARITRASTRQATAASKANPGTASSKINASKSTNGAKEKGDDDAPGRRRKRSATASRSSLKRIKKEDDPDPSSPKTPSKPIKSEPRDSDTKDPSLKTSFPFIPSPSSEAPSPSTLHTKKLKAYTQYAAKSPFPDFPHPTASEAKLAHDILASIHGAQTRPEEIKAPSSRSGCGDSPSVLDALVRTILSQNTSDANSTRAKRSMDSVYGGSDEWEAIAEGGTAKLQEAITCGGLAATKSKVIIGILAQTKEKYGKYSLDHLFGASNEDAMQELIGFQGVGPKTASCVLLFCLRRESFAVDTHVWRITGLLGWRPRSATRDETHAHLDVMIPDEDKYGLHILLVKHGRVCEECKAGGKNLGKCELRKAFREKAKKGGLDRPEPDMP